MKIAWSWAVNAGPGWLELSPVLGLLVSVTEFSVVGSVGLLVGEVSFSYTRGS